jgi:hypothetical protein
MLRQYGSGGKRSEVPRRRLYISKVLSGCRFYILLHARHYIADTYKETY